MSRYTKAASYILDTLWENDSFRTHFHALDVDLADLGPLTQAVFEPAYITFKADLDPHALQMLDNQVTRDLLMPLQHRQGFRALWDQWDVATRVAFIHEQTELQLAKLLIQVYDQQLDTAYRAAYTRYRAGQPQQD